MSATTIRTLLRTARAAPASRRAGPTWSEFLRAQADGIIACDFFTVETTWLRTLYVLVFIELGSRRIHVGPSTVHPDSTWVTQQARNLALRLDGRSPSFRLLIRDRDAKFSGPFDTVLRSEGIRVIRTPFQAPNANAPRRARDRDAPGRVPRLVTHPGSAASRPDARTYADHYNGRRPHRALGLASPLAAAGEPIPANPRDVRRRDLLGGVVHEYHRAAA